MAMPGQCICTPEKHCREEPPFKPPRCPCKKCKERQRAGDKARSPGPDTKNPERPVKDGKTNGRPGPEYYGNEPMDFFVTFILEILGVLAFFAIATIMFWVSIAYYVTKLVCDFKNTDRNIKRIVIAISCLLLLGFFISLVTNKKDCPKPPKCPKCPRPKCPHQKKGSCAKCAQSGKQWGFRNFFKSKNAKCVKCSKHHEPGKCAKSWSLFKASNAKCQHCSKQHPPGKCPFAKSKPKTAKCKVTSIQIGGRRIYRDCDGRSIYQKSKRYAIPTEMKQPPTLLVHLRDWLASFINGGSHR